MDIIMEIEKESHNAALFEYDYKMKIINDDIYEDGAMEAHVK